MVDMLARKVQSSKLIYVPDLIESKLTDKAISKGMGKAKFPKLTHLAEAFSVKVSDIMTKLKSTPAKTGKYLSHVGCWEKWQTNKKEFESELEASQSKMDVDGKPVQRKLDEEQVAEFFNEIADGVRLEYGIDGTTPKARIFSACFKDHASADAPVDCIRKPVCVGLDQDKAEPEGAAWRDIRARELLDCAHMVFAAQHNRRFVLGAVLQYSTMFFFVFDRSGVLCSEGFNINREPEKLVRIVCGILFVDETRLGYDPTIAKSEEGGYHIWLNGLRHKCEEPLYTEKSVHGRGTGCFKTVHDGQDAVIKDSWVDDSRKKLEHEILEKVKDVEGVVKVINHEIVQIEGENDTTGTDRQVLVENDTTASS